MMLSKVKIGLLVIVIALLSSCKTEKRNKQVFLDSPNLFLVELDNGETEIIRKNYNNDLIFDNWNAYNFSSSELLRIEEADYKISRNRIVNLRKFITTLSETTPEWLETKEVVEKIIDVEEEYDDLMYEIESSTKTVRENCRALNKEFEELRENIHKVVEDYTNG